jgi:hypothetical protein
MGLTMEPHLRFSIGLIVFATGDYIGYCNSLIASIVTSVRNQKSWRFYVFTDEPDRLWSLLDPSVRDQVMIIQINSMSFPEASLMRYQLICNYFKDVLPGEDVLVFSDADMLFVRDPSAIKLGTDRQPTFTLHPGFWRPALVEHLKVYLNSPRVFLIDLYLRLRYGGIGTWETRPRSSAYIPRSARKAYFCGGFWFANRLCFLRVCEEIAHSIQVDQENGLMASWHDESYLNAFALRADKIELDPSYCFEPSYPQLRSLTPIVVAVNKLKSKGLKH